MKETDKEKRIYKEWIEYLRRSDDYKIFCDIIQKKKRSPSFPIPHKFKDSKYPSNYFMFGPIHSSEWNFDEWWKYRKHALSLLKGLPVKNYIARKILKINDEWQATGIVEDLSQVFDRLFHSCISTFKFYNENREPTLSEFKEYFCKQLKDGDAIYQDIVLRIDPRGEKTEIILSELKRIIKRKRQLAKVMTKELHSKLYLKPTTRHIRLDELERYRKVYDLRKKDFDPRNIIQMMNPKDDCENPDVQRSYRDFFLKAKKIITNVESGMFPGAYDETTLRRKKRNAKKQ